MLPTALEILWEPLNFYDASEIPYPSGLSGHGYMPVANWLGSWPKSRVLGDDWEEMDDVGSGALSGSRR